MGTIKLFFTRDGSIGGFPVLLAVQMSSDVAQSDFGLRTLLEANSWW